MSGTLPRGWVLRPLPEIAQINPPLDCAVSGDDTPVTFVPMRAIGVEGVGLVAPETRPYGDVKRGFTAFRSSDVIMAKITPCMENGKTMLVPEVPGGVCFGSTEFHVIRPAAGVNGKYIEQFLLRHETRRDAQRQMGGAVGQMRVPAAFLQSLQVPVPPRAEQDRIAEFVDEATLDLDAGTAALQRCQEKLARYRASVLQAAVEGDLTADWRKRHPDAEPASKLLQRILAERRRRWEQEQRRAYAEKGKALPKNWKAKYKEPVAVTEDGLPPLPTGWAWATLDQLASPEQRAMTDGPFGSNLKTSHYTSSGPRVIRLQNVGDGEFLEADAHISHDHFQALKRYEAKPGDIVFASLGTSLPRSCVLPDHIGPAIVKADCVRFRPSAKVSTACINHFVNANPTRQRAKRLIHGVGRPRLSLSALRTVAIPLAPLKEQRTIANAIRDQMDGIRKAESALGDELVRATRLRQSILHRAFTGSLLPQDPADEPASKLIERITRERRTRPRSSRRSTRGKVSTAQ